jgi:hypothetical protein
MKSCLELTINLTLKINVKLRTSFLLAFCKDFPLAYIRPGWLSCQESLTSDFNSTDVSMAIQNPSQVSRFKDDVTL